MEYVYKITDESEETYWLEDKEQIYPSFGKCLEVVRYRLIDPEDITDSINGEYI